MQGVGSGENPDGSAIVKIGEGARSRLTLPDDFHGALAFWFFWASKRTENNQMMILFLR